MKKTQFVPLTVLVVLVLSVLLARQHNEDSNIQNARFNSSIVAEQIAVRLKSFISTRLTVGDHLSHEWSHDHINTPESFQKQTMFFHKLHPEFQAINWVDDAGVIRWVTPSKGNKGAIGFNLNKHAVAGAVLAEAFSLGKIQATRPLELTQGGQGIAAYFPLQGKNGPEGYINLVFRTRPLVEGALKQDNYSSFNYQITDNGIPVFNQGDVDIANPLTVFRTFKVANREWTVAMMPTALAYQIWSSKYANLAVAFALLISFGLSWLLLRFLQHQEQIGEKTLELEATLGNLVEGITMVDSNLNIVIFNQRFLELLDFPLKKFKKGDPFESFIRFNAERGEYGPGDAEEQVRERVERAKKFEPHYFERTMPSGTILAIHGHPIPEGGFVTSYSDITERKQAEKALQQSEARFAKAFNSSPASIAIAGLQDGIIHDVNNHWCETTGYKRSEVIGTSVAELGLWQNFKQRNKLIKMLMRDRSIRDFEAILVTRNGTELDCVFNGEIIDIDNSERLLLVFHDVTQRKQAEDRALHMAGHDPLTGLPNRILMRDRLEQELYRAKRNDSKVAILFVDLNDFKLVNDRLGHKSGDQALQIIAQTMKKSVRASDTVARFGGDEFVIIMPDVADQSSIGRACEELGKALTKLIDLNGTEVRLGASIGITLFPDHASTPETLLDMADKAMYELKDNNDVFGYKFADPTD